MSLFQTSVLKKHLKGLDTSKVDAAWSVFKAHFHNATIQQNIRNAKEEQYQGEFLIDLFVKVFGYVKNPQPDFNLTTELKNIKGAKKTDGAILQDENALAVIELKGTKVTDLNKIETQAFGYKNNHPECVYVITSNFEKLRFYIDNAVEYEEFNLFKLTKDQFDILWLCVASGCLLKGIPKSIKDESLTQEDRITKQLYKDYSTFRNEIFQSIQELNPEHDKLTLFKKTQKLLDRFLFIFFAEDRLLLPPNSIREIIRQWTTLKEELDAYVPLFDRFKKYFGYLNTGHKGKKHDIYAYNGGLFAPDDILDNIKIDDTLLYNHTQKLSNYDFESEVSVNILGHIFEHSLNEIEEIQAEIGGIETDKSKSKRKKDGVFYTPKYITKYIVDNTIGKLCKEKKEELGIDEEEYQKDRKGRKVKTLKALQTKLETYREWLLQLTICDPACGSGAFLNQALEFLIAEHKLIDELMTKLLGGELVLPNVENTILENNLFGVDINNESVEIAKLSLWLRTAKHGRKLTTLNDNIKCGNSLIDDPEVAGDKAFHWESEFPEVFAKGGFDVVIGNPPYVSSREVSINEDEKYFYIKSYKNSVYQIDLYLLFIEKCKYLTRGICSLIVPNAWLNNVFLEDVRNYLLTSTVIESITDLPESVFSDANVDTLIFTYSDNLSPRETQLFRCINQEFQSIGKIQQNVWLENSGKIINISASGEMQIILKKIRSNSYELSNLTKIGRGVGVYHKRVGHTKELIKKDPFQSKNKEDDTFLPYLRGKHIQYWNLIWNNDSYISYGDWLAEPREPAFFEGERILLRQIPAKRLIVTFTNDKFIIDQSVFIARFLTNDLIKPKAVLGILASKLFSFYFKYNYEEFDQLFPKVKLQQFKSFPITKNPKSNLLVKLSKQRLDATSKIFNNQTSFNSLLSSRFEIKKLSKKLGLSLTQDFKVITKELRKLKIKLSLSEEAEWMQYFEEQKTKALAIQQQIDQTDREIDQMVYELYGLTEDEIRIVEDSISG